MNTVSTPYTSSNKDNIASLTLIAASLFALACGLFTSNQADAVPSAHPGPVQKLETIVVTASRHADIKLDAIVVTASRGSIRAA